MDSSLACRFAPAPPGRTRKDKQRFYLPLNEKCVMKILVANLGSTSFKYRLFDMTDERVLARGGVERIGSDRSRCYVQAGAITDESILAAPDHAGPSSFALSSFRIP